MINPEYFYDIFGNRSFANPEYWAIRKPGFQFPKDEPIEVFPDTVRDNFKERDVLLKHLTLMIKELKKSKQYKDAKRKLNKLHTLTCIKPKEKRIYTEFNIFELSSDSKYKFGVSELYILWDGKYTTICTDNIKKFKTLTEAQKDKYHRDSDLKLNPDNYKSLGTD